MPNFIRKIELAKWKPDELIKGNDKTTADAVTNCLKTSRNTLSIWEYEEGKEEDAVLAIVSNFTNIDKTDFIFFTHEELDEYNLKTMNNQGKSLFTAYNSNHYDIHGLDYFTLGDFSEIVKNIIKSKKQIRFTKSSLVKLLAKGVIDQKINLNLLKDDVKVRVERELGIAAS